jgi:hypothetical protein
MAARTSVRNPNPGNPEIQKSRNPEIQKSRNPEIRRSGDPGDPGDPRGIGTNGDRTVPSGEDTQTPNGRSGAGLLGQRAAAVTAGGT